MLIIWILLAWWSATIAKKKGRKAWFGFGVGLIFGIFAVIYYSLVSKKELKA